MKPSQVSYLYQQEVLAEEQGALVVGMDLDDADPIDVFSVEVERQPADADFFNSFEDDFDDSDVA